MRGIMRLRFVPVMAAPLAGEIKALAQYRDQLIMGARHHSRKAVMSGIDRKAHGREYLFIALGPMDEAEDALI